MKHWKTILQNLFITIAIITSSVSLVTINNHIQEEKQQEYIRGIYYRLDTFSDVLEDYTSKTEELPRVENKVEVQNTLQELYLLYFEATTQYLHDDYMGTDGTMIRAVEVIRRLDSLLEVK